VPLAKLFLLVLLLMKRNDDCKIAGLILAGGLSSRMGECKALMRIKRTSALEVIVTRMKASGVRAITVVTGAYAEAVRKEAVRLGCRVEHNPAFMSGMFSSVIAGVKAFKDRPDAFFTLPVDIPLVKPYTYRSMIDAFGEGYGTPEVVYPFFMGERGHPPLVGREMIDSIIGWDGVGGLHGLLENCTRSLDVRTADRAILLDMDTRDDYEELLRYNAGEKIPDEDECSELLSIAGTPKKVVRHMKIVASCAMRLADALETNGIDLDRRLLLASCLLHDIAKGGKDHEARGAELLRERGYSKVAELVASHKDLSGKLGKELIMEAEILYLSDKITDGEAISTLKNRMLRMETRFAPESEALAAAKQRIKHASEIQKKVERITGQQLEEIVREKLAVD
jgi:putative nucleotidyltransferase with HDIG domain